MMIVVVGVTSATLFITQRQVHARYERTLRSRFDEQIAHFMSLQQTRLAHVGEQCERLSQNVRLMGPLKERSVDPETLYGNAGDELPLVFGSHPHFVGFLDRNGRPLLPSGELLQELELWISREHLEQELASVHGIIAGQERKQVGYLALVEQTNAIAAPNPNSLPQQPSTDPIPDAAQAGTAIGPVDRFTQMPVIHEVIITKMVDESGDKTTFGAMLISFPLLEPSAQPRGKHPSSSPMQPMQSGILLEGSLYPNSAGISESNAALIARVVSQQIGAKPSAEGDFECEILKTPYRVFYQQLSSAFAPAYQVCLYPLEEARQEQRELTWRFLAAGGFGLLGALLLSWLLSNGLVVGIRELVAGTREVQRGNLETKVPVRSRDEIGTLAASFNEMTQGLSEKEKYRVALNMLADEKVAKKLVNGEITLGGQSREVSILFCDIRGFTPLSQTMPPEEVITMLNEHMTALTRVVKENRGLVDKFVGDAIMVLFGAPISYGQDSLDAARCALGFIQERNRLNQTSRHKLKIGIGLATGQVLAGGMGSIDRLNYTAIGERVNLAARLCSAAAPGEILIDQTTRAELGDLVIAEPGVELQLKGYSVPVQAYRLLEMREQMIPA